nr:MAG TPA: tail tape measure protein [Caudoviricetes sp.]
MDVFNLYAKLSLNTDDYEKGVEKAKGGASSLMDVFSGTLLGNVVSDGLRTVANGITEIGKTAANMAVSIGKASLDSYADYEQLVGGVETLYKDSAGIIENYAKDAYKNVGLSANDYMETSTSFAAALVSSLSGDTEKAAEMANTAISDMSDNANKMGTNISSIQDAYNGFAKQNYTMLDNLKLGYGGTQAEMKRLIKEAAAMKDTQKELGVTVDATSMSYANIVQAIHVVQANMGIMGTTSKEAATTIQGSTASMKSAWENLLTGIADPEQDFQTLVDNLVDSVITAGNNIIPRIKEIVPTLIDGLSELVTQLAPYISGVIMELEPTIEEGLQALFGGLSSVASELQPIVADVFSFLGDAIISGLTSAIENSDFSFLIDIFDNVKTAAEEVVPVIEKIAPALVTVGAAVKGWQIGTKIQKMVTAFDEAKVAVSLFSMGLSDTEIAQGALNGTLKASEVLAGLLTGKISLMTLAQTAAAKAQAVLNAVMSANPIAIVITLIAALIGVFVTLYATNEDFRNKVNEIFEFVKTTVVTFFTETVPNAINSAIEWFQQLPDKISEFMSNAVQSVADWATQTAENARQAGSQFLQNVVEFFTQLPGNVLTFLSTTIQNVIAWAGQMKSNAIDAASTFLNNVIEFFTQLPGNIAEWFTKTIEKVVEWAVELKNKGTQAAKDLLDAVVTGLAELPGKIFDLGVNAAKNLLEGIKSMGGWLKEQVGDFVDGIASGFTGTMQTNGSHAGGLDYVPYNNYVANLHRGEMVLTSAEATEYRKGNANAASGMTFNININGIQFDDVNSMAHALANQISYELQAQSNRKAAVYA